MCDPLTIGSLVLTAAGTGMQMQSQRRAQKGIEGAIRENDNKNDALRTQSQAAVLDNTNKFSRENFDKNQQDETAKVQTKLTDALSQGKLPGEYYGGPMSENTKRYTEQKTAQTNDFSNSMAEALAKLRGFGQGQAVNTQGIQRAGEVVGMNRSKEAGNNAVLPLAIDAAKRKGQNPLADLMVGFGTAGVGAGLSGAQPFGAQGGLSRLFTTGHYGFTGPIQPSGIFNLV